MLHLLARLLDAYQMLIFVWAIMSWLPARPGGATEAFRSGLSAIVEPYVGLFRRVVPVVGGIDVSPWVAIVALQVVERVLL
ncbi:YggT family protein [Olsenella massiliensis]|uniref:YggT family protein n=1 Tax=Olsenella massiliensis TaxID=1622075 RepID=UPI00071E4A6C|nr:YggT family protein [Olsenella massiliensis]